MPVHVPVAFDTRCGLARFRASLRYELQTNKARPAVPDGAVAPALGALGRRQSAIHASAGVGVSPRPPHAESKWEARSIGRRV